MMVRNVIAPILGAVMAALVATCNEGCYPVQSPAQSYEAELKACVDNSKTLEESRACRRKVDEKWHVCETFPDACLP